MIAIIDYGAGNVRSVQNAFTKLGATTVLTSDSDIIAKAKKVVFPGVGEASTAMKQLQQNGIDRLLPKLTQPVLGICLGMQLMCTKSEEGNTPGLNLFETDVKLFPSTDIVPHMGWNSVERTHGKLLSGLDGADFYFVHSFYADLAVETAGICNYILSFSAVLEKDNFYGTQFHPEKSGDAGFELLRNFLKL